MSVNGTHLEAQMGALLSSVILPHHALEMPCAGYGRCGKCRVVAHGALSALSDAEREHLSPQDISRGVRLACCARVEGDCTVTLEGAAASQIRLAGEMPDFVHDPIFSVCGAAVDIGTTTLASCLYGPDGTLLAQASAPNPQAGWGADVISRIEAALHGSGDALAASVRAGVRALVLEMAASAHISAEAVDALVITGNTAMLYLLTQTDPDCLSHAPFAASRLFGETLAAGELGLPCPHAQVYLPRCMSAFVGADITTALLASGICSKPDTRMLVDIGTNGEIALWHRGQLSCCSTAAGPAFEGPGFMGMAERRAQWITSAYRTAHCRPTSLGAARRKDLRQGVIDALACLVELEQLDETGLLEQDPAPVAPPVCLTQKDVRMVQLAKSAICAGLSTLLRVEGLCGRTRRLAVAGGFGSYLDVDSAGRIGLLPEELVPRVRVLGNAALSGAAMLLLNRGFIPRSEALAAGARTVDLSTSAEFMNAYTEGMFF
ncbi:MAG: ASKHA domain-containing protein [Ruthenibacterium lactatiformans]